VVETEGVTRRPKNSRGCEVAAAGGRQAEPETSTDAHFGVVAKEDQNSKNEHVLLVFGFGGW